jgi:predicted nucleic-acid-binding protein
VIAFDSNVIVRLMVEDDQPQVRRARQLLKEAAERDELVFLSDIVLCELEWVLGTAYDVPRRRILGAMRALLADERYCFADQKRVTTALTLYQDGKGDLADYLLGLHGEGAGVGTTYTFDRELRDNARFTLVPR